MAYRLSIADDLATSARVCAREQLEGAIERLEGADKNPVVAIHEARKHLKKARALLRLVRPALGAKPYRRENRELRDAGLALSGARDADVLVETLDKLAERFAGRLPATDFEQLRAALAAEGTTAAGERAVVVDLPAVVELLRGSLARVEEWPLANADWDVAIAGAQRSYARGRDAFVIARHEPTPEHLHEWRKRVKDLWYHERLLAAAWPAIVGAHGEEAHVLSEYLGDDHDLAVLRVRLEPGQPAVELPAAAGADLAPLLELVEERRSELREQSTRLGRRLYAESPKAFGRRLAAYVRTALGEQRRDAAA